MAVVASIPKARAAAAAAVAVVPARVMGFDAAAVPARSMGFAAAAGAAPRQPPTAPIPAISTTVRSLPHPKNQLALPPPLPTQN